MYLENTKKAYYFCVPVIFLVVITSEGNIMTQYLHVERFFPLDMLEYYGGEFRESLLLMSVDDILPGPALRGETEAQHGDRVLMDQLHNVSLH